MPTATATGLLRERVTVQTPDPRQYAVATLTRSGTTATATTGSAHGFVTGDYVTIADADQAEYNGTVEVTVTSTTAFTFTVDGGATTPATGHVTATYYRDSQGGRVVTWRTARVDWAELVPLGTGERLQREAMGAETALRFRLRARADLVPTMRLRWRASWDRLATERTLEIRGVLPVDDGRTWVLVDCVDVQ